MKNEKLNVDVISVDMGIDNFEDIELFADELDDRVNAIQAGTISSATCLSSASSGGTSSASCACTTSTLCSS